MATEENNWKQFPDHIGAWDEAPPPEVFSRLEAMLEAPAPEAKIRPFRPGKWIIGLLIPFVILLGWWWFSSDETPTKNGPSATIGDSTPPLPIVGPVPAVETPVPHADPKDGLTSQTKPFIGIATPNPPSPSLDSIHPARLPMRSIADLDVQNIGLLSNRNRQSPDIPQTREDSLRHYVTAPFPDIHAPQQVSNRAFNSIFQQGDWSSQQAPMLQNFANDVSYSPRGRSNPEQSTTISELNWILGSWKKMGPSGAAFEEWKRVDKYTLTGRGFFVVNGDTIITDRMQIREMPDGLYYIVAVDTSRQSHKYRLRHTGPGKAIFQTEQNDNEYRIEFEAPNDQQLNITRNRHHGPGLGTETEKLNREAPGVDEYQDPEDIPTKGKKLKKGY